MWMIVASASKHGSTEGIAEAIAEQLHQLGNDAAAARVGDVDNLDGVDAVVRSELKSTTKRDSHANWLN